MTFLQTFMSSLCFIATSPTFTSFPLRHQTKKTRKLSSRNLKIFFGGISLACLHALTWSITKIYRKTYHHTYESIVWLQQKKFKISQSTEPQWFSVWVFSSGLVNLPHLRGSSDTPALKLRSVKVEGQILIPKNWISRCNSSRSTCSYTHTFIV